MVPDGNTRMLSIPGISIVEIPTGSDDYICDLEIRHEVLGAAHLSGAG